jgi:uncharacterized protein YecT (DUF1311 family)
MPRILTALLLLCLSPLARAQFTGPKAPPPPPPKQVVIPAPQGQSASAQPTPEAWADPCAANASTVNFDTCYADLNRATDQLLNNLYRNAVVAFEADVADAHKRSDQSQLSYDSIALFDLKAAQDQWTKYRALQCRAAGQQLQGGSIQPIVINKCLILVTHHRIDEIRAAYEIGGRNLE